MAKKIVVTDNLAISFEQRAQGEETPYWQGTAWRKSGTKWEEIGHFQNHGTGGNTMIDPQAEDVMAVAVLRANNGRYNFRMSSDPPRPGVLASPEVSTLHAFTSPFERESAAETLITYAEILLKLGCAVTDWTLSDHLDWEMGKPIAFPQDGLQMGKPLPGREGDIERYKTADRKLARLEMSKRAKRLASKGEFLVEVTAPSGKVDYFAFKTNDPQRIQAMLKHGETFIVIT